LPLVHYTRRWQDDRAAPNVVLHGRDLILGRVDRERARQEVFAGITIGDYPELVELRRNSQCLGTMDSKRAGTQADSCVAWKRHPFGLGDGATEWKAGRRNRPLVLVAHLALQSGLVFRAEVCPAQVTEELHRVTDRLGGVLQFHVDGHPATVV